MNTSLGLRFRTSALGEERLAKRADDVIAYEPPRTERGGFYEETFGGKGGGVENDSKRWVEWRRVMETAVKWSDGTRRKTKIDDQNRRQLHPGLMDKEDATIRSWSL